MLLLQCSFPLYSFLHGEKKGTSEGQFLLVGIRQPGYLCVKSKLLTSCPSYLAYLLVGCQLSLLPWTLTYKIGPLGVQDGLGHSFDIICCYIAREGYLEWALVWFNTTRSAVGVSLIT